MKFTDFDFNENIQKGIDEAGFTECMPVQEETFKTVLASRDVFAQSQTGTGKTAAFLISIFQMLLEDKHFKGQKALVIVPTRELAVQIEAEAQALGKFLDFRVGSFYGGVGYNEQEKMLDEGCDVLIGTPGRLIDFGQSGKIRFGEMGILVIDEADRLFDMGFLPDLRKILGKMPPADERRTMLFSATLNAKVGNLAWEYMNDPGEIVIEPEQVTVDAITQELYHVSAEEKMSLLLGVMKRDAPETAIIFANTKHTTYEVAKRLEHNGYHAKCLMGDLPQKKRLRIVEEAKEGKTPFLVATDVAARGLHINDLAMVVNYDVPTDAESYVHRIGRTARAGKTGKAITLACEKFVYGLPAIEKLTGQKIPVSWADEDLMEEDKSAGMRFHFDRRAGYGEDSRGRGPRSSRNARGARQGSRSGGLRGNKRPLDRRAAKVQSAVLAVSGNMDDLDEGLQSASAGARGGHSSTGAQRQGKRHSSGYKSRRPVDKRSRNRNEAYVPSSIPMERVTSNDSLEDRLAYYKAKYGEDFEAQGKSSKNAGSRRFSGGKSSSGRKHASGRNKNKGNYDKPFGKRNLRAGGGSAPLAASGKTGGDKPEGKSEKKGFLARLFGRK